MPDHSAQAQVWAEESGTNQRKGRGVKSIVEKTMGYKYKEWTGEEAQRRAQMRYPAGAGVSAQEADDINLLELHVSAFSDPGPDWNEFRGTYVDGGGNKVRVWTRRYDGY